MASRTVAHRRLGALVAVASLVSFGCGATAGKDVATGTSANERNASTTTTSGEDGTTTEPDRSTTTTTASSTDEELRSALPTLADVGAPYAAAGPDDESTDSAAGDAAIKKACPEATALDTGAGNDDEGQVSANFKTEDGRTIEVSAKPGAADFDETQLDEQIDAINACDVIKYEEAGSAVEMTLTAERVDSYGDLGVRFHIGIEIAGSGPSGGKPLRFTFEGVTFAVGDLSGAVFVTSGIEALTFDPVDPDVDRIDPLATDLAKALDRLAD